MNQPFNPFSPQSAPSPFGAPQAPAFGQAPVPQFGAPQAQAPVQLHPGMFGGMGSAEASDGRKPPLPQGGHDRVRIDSIQVKRGDPSQGTSHQTFLIADLTVLESKICPAGTVGSMVETIAGAQYNQADALARVRMLINAALGVDDRAPETRAKWEDPNQAYQLMAGAASGQLNGKEFAVLSVAHKVTKKGRTIGTYKCGVIGAQVNSAPVQSAAPVYAAAPSFPPAGWVASPQYPGHFTGIYQGKTVTVSENDLKAAVTAGSI